MNRAIHQSRPYLRIALAAATAWTLLAGASLAWNLNSLRTSVERAAVSAARMAFEKDVVYREWNSMHGGVYVPIGPYAQPNVHLEDLVDRDLVTVQGRRLTLINPAYMNRQVHEIELSRTGTRGHLTSLDPVRPENAPDPWEKKALEGMSEGAKELTGIQEIEGEEYLRLIRPLMTEEACLKCHRQHGYETGQLRGGLSVSTPVAPFRAAVAGSERAIWFWHLSSWLIGLVGIAFAASRLTTYYREREVSEKLIRHSLEEKTALVREVHHRVKNNLQVISGMLELQATLLDDPAAANVLYDSRNRIMSIALIHQKLYQSESLSRVLMDAYLQSLVADLFTAFGYRDGDVELALDAEPARLSIDTAIPFGLMVSELVTNALKYAFPPGSVDERPRIAISFGERHDGIYHLEVTDNGIGMPDDYNLEGSSSLGIKLVKNLVEQLGGQISRSGPPGTSWTITCPPSHETEDPVIVEPPVQP